MKIPFLNRKRFIVLRCYTWHAGVLEKAPLFIGDGAKVKTHDKEEFIDQQSNFSTCWSRIATRKNCVTIPSPCEIRFEADGNTVFWRNAKSTDVLDIDFTHDFDESYGSNKSTTVAKILWPWHIEDDSGVNFVTARHMQNHTMLNVLSGLINFKHTCQVNTFALINRMEHRFSVPFKMPISALYPMSDLPLHVECEVNRNKYDEILQRKYLPYFHASSQKKEKEL